MGFNLNYFFIFFTWLFVTWCDMSFFVGTHHESFCHHALKFARIDYSPMYAPLNFSAKRQLCRDAQL